MTSKEAFSNGRKESVQKWLGVLALIDDPDTRTLEDFDGGCPYWGEGCGLCDASLRVAGTDSFPRFCEVCPLPHGRMCHKSWAAIQRIVTRAEADHAGDDEQRWIRVRPWIRRHAEVLLADIKGLKL